MQRVAVHVVDSLQIHLGLIWGFPGALIQKVIDILAPSQIKPSRVHHRSPYLVPIPHYTLCATEIHVTVVTAASVSIPLP